MSEKNKKLNIYKVSQNIVQGYDTYDSFICVAESYEKASLLHPSIVVEGYGNKTWIRRHSRTGEEIKICGHGWIGFDQRHLLIIEKIGTANDDQKEGIVLASFNAG